MPLAILQARMSSRRLPGKVLAPVLGRPLILRAVERISRARHVDGVVLATSVDASDDALADAAESAGVVVRRGSLQNVLERFVEVLDEFQPEHAVRLTGDNVLVDPDVIDLVITHHAESGADYTSNVLPRTFPRGLDVEVVRADVLRTMLTLGPDRDEREHVTLGVYRRPERFRLQSVTQAVDRSELRWTVDYPEDLEFARSVYAVLYQSKPDFGQEDVVELLERRPELRRTERDVAE